MVQITNDDRILVDEWDYPFTFYGINADATWKGFTFSILLQGQGKQYKRSQYDNRGVKPETITSGSTKTAGRQPTPTPKLHVHTTAMTFTGRPMFA
jgi:hypothetical protein